MTELILVITPKKPFLSIKQLDRLSEFCSQLSVVSLASTVLPVFLGLDKLDPAKVILGTLVGLTLLFVSLKVLKK